MCGCSVVSNSLQPHGLWPTRLLCPWDFPRQEYWSGWIAIPFFRGSSQPRDRSQVSHIAGRFFTTEPPGNPLSVHWSKIKSQRQSFGCSRKFSSVQFSRSIMSNSLQPYGLQHTRLPCPSPTSRVCLNSCPSSQ